MRNNPNYRIRLLVHCIVLCGGCFVPSACLAAEAAPGTGFDIAPFALPHSASGEIRFEEPRDIERVTVTFARQIHDKVGISYLQQTWPNKRIENERPFDNPAAFGWFPIDDGFNSEWHAAETLAGRNDPRTATFAFKPLSQEFSDCADYDVAFRRTLGIRIDAEHPEQIESVRVYTVSPSVKSGLRVELDAGSPTPGGTIRLSSYNAEVESVIPEEGVEVDGLTVKLTKDSKRAFRLGVSHMQPAHLFCHDEGMVTFALDSDTFTLSLASLEREGPIWFSDLGVFVTRAVDPTSFANYQARCADTKNIAQMVTEAPEQGFGGPLHGQPRPHPVAYDLGWKYNRERFWLEPNGDLLLPMRNVTWIPGKDTLHYKNDGDGRFFFGLERWITTGRFNDPSPVLAYNIHVKRGTILLEQKSFATPLAGTSLGGDLASDETIVACVRFRFTNTGSEKTLAELPIHYSGDSRRSENRILARRARGEEGREDDNLVPRSPLVKLTAQEGFLLSDWQSEPAIRARYETRMEPSKHDEGLVFSHELAPGESCDLILKIPFVAPDTEEDKSELARLDFDQAYRATTDFWRSEQSQSDQIHTPEPRLDALHAAHQTHVAITDFTMLDGSGLINTSVGTSTYGNFANESCMIIHELDERGLHEDARRRLDLWVKYQGTKGTLGNFTDHEGVYYGAGGFEQGEGYNQHHGWVLWCLAEHFFLSHDDAWLSRTADSMIAGADWIFRQRRETMKPLPHSRGWEYGFLPAGALEDVQDYFYWLSTNALTWRGADRAARALAAIGHPQAARLQREADAYKSDLIHGFETMRQHTPLVRLRDGRWVPNYPSRLYWRGRDMGWIREVLEGSVYLLISGLYSPNSKQAQWILDDYQDNRYMNPPYGYPVPDREANWFDYGGFSIQPNLLAGLLPYLDRDEPEMYIWMFFNAWCACYREEIGAMVEHPMPFLGFYNTAHFKTSDESNATSWLRYLFVYSASDTLHLGRAIPREWFTQDETLEAQRVVTRFGQVSVAYHPHLKDHKIEATADLSLWRAPKQTLLRIRHPEKLPIKSVTMNGKAYKRFDAAKGDIDLTGLAGHISVEASY
jgi:hypothetical protein